MIISAATYNFQINVSYFFIHEALHFPATHRANVYRFDIHTPPSQLFSLRIEDYKPAAFKLCMALKYQCSYQQVRNWVKRYEEMGSKGLEDRRGRRVGSLPSRTPEEELRDRIVELERKNLDLQMENDLLKKVRELERRDHYL